MVHGICMHALRHVMRGKMLEGKGGGVQKALLPAATLLHTNMHIYRDCSLKQDLQLEDPPSSRNPPLWLPHS